MRKMNNRFRKYALALIMVVTVICTASIFVNEADASKDGTISFTDANQISPWAKAAISEAVDKGLVSGSGGKINPKGAITRAEFTKLIVVMLGLDLERDVTLPFTDVRHTDWYYPFVKAGYDHQLVAGYSDTQFLPHGSITRQEMAVMLVRALNMPAQSLTERMKDHTEMAPWARTAVETAVSASLMQGHEQYFQPSALATREMAFVVVMRAYDYAGPSDREEEPVSKPDASTARSTAVTQLIQDNVRFMQEMTPNPTLGSIGGEWTILALARSEVDVPASYFETYYQNVVGEVQRLMPARGSKPEGRLDRNKGTEHARLILALTALGKNIEAVGGYDLRQALADYQYVKIQGINGPLFALIAFDSLNYDIPQDSQVEVQTTREGLIANVLEREIADGGWALGQNPDAPDVDITAMAIQALTPYYTQRQDVRAAVDRALVWLSAQQDPSGGYASWGTSNSESAAQVVVALSGLGIDADADPRFIKNGHSVLAALLNFASPTGGFYHILEGDAGNGGAAPGMVDPMATDQAMYALIAYDRYVKGKNRLYDMRDATSQ